MMMTSVRIVSPIIDTPSSTPDATRDDRRHRNDRRQDQAAVAAQQDERDAFEQPRLGDHRHEERQAEDEEHRVGVDQVVQPVERQQVRAASTATSRAPRSPRATPRSAARRTSRR